ncbi:hypothetical protein [Streptomyces sp. NBC_01262]|uniref:hypothetical protein n=1 Tax=Streptomyces sp. NBC_01262 TaxID=2903803 RepID=UPI002E34129F|nr:hypothetical protein [Streptomyces sp. NBC_01262]
MEILAGQWWESGSWWQFAITIVASLVLGGLATWSTMRSNNPKRKISWRVQSNTALFESPRLSTGARVPLSVSLGQTRLAKPRIVELVIANQGRRDITAAMFHEGAAMKFDFGIDVSAVLEVTTTPAGSLCPEVDTWQELIPGTGGRMRGGLEIRPCLLSRRQSVTVTVMVDGDEVPVRCTRFPLVDVDVTTVPTASHGAGRG